MPPPASTTLLSTGRSIPTLAFCEAKFASVGVNGAKGPRSAAASVLKAVRIMRRIGEAMSRATDQASPVSRTSWEESRSPPRFEAAPLGQSSTGSVPRGPACA